MPRPLLAVLAVTLITAACALSLPAHASPASRFVDATLWPHTDTRDSLAACFDPWQLPLLMASLASDPPLDTDPDRLYRAMARWHYYAGRHFDPRQTGLWTTGQTTFEGEVHVPSNVTLATGASLELVELAALARLAFDRENVFDALVWWQDHLELTGRLTNLLYDPVDGAWADLDSLGRRQPEPTLSSLVPVALGARHGGEATRMAAWKLWTGKAERADQGDARAAGAARMAADAFEAWSTDLGLHLVSPEAMASLSLQALDDLDEPVLSIFVRDALAARGIAPRDSIHVQLGAWGRSVATDDLALEPLERSATALRFLGAIGVFSPATTDSLLAITRADSDSLTRAVSLLTDALVELRGMDVRRDAGQWAQRRDGADDLDPDDRAAFDFQWPDLRVWFDRALDLITADVLAFHMRPDHASGWTATLDPPVVGHGDAPRLSVHARDRQAGQQFASATLTLMWTDGAQLLPPADCAVRRVDERNFVCDVPPLPQRNGLWHLIVEGLPERPRMAPAVSVVEPVIVSVLPVERRGATVEWAVQLRSQVRRTLDGRVDLETPLAWTSAPATSQPYTLASGEVRELKFSVTPDREVAPGTYPLGWTIWSSARLIGQFDEPVDRPLSWLRVGALPVTEPANPIDSRYDFDRQIDLAQRVEGVGGMVAWTKLPAERVDARGFVSPSEESSSNGVHYAFTAFVTQSRESILEFESEGPARVFVNGKRIISMDRWGGRREVEVDFGSGTNFVVVKLIQDAGTAARFRMRVRDIDGLPLRGLGNELERLVENYAYLARARHSAGVAEERQTLRLVPIRYEDPTARSVSVVGSFNGWSPASTPMTRGEDGSWQVKIRLRPGRFEYKFAVDGSEWIRDPANPAAVDDGFGGRNSVLVVD